MLRVDAGKELVEEIVSGKTQIQLKRQSGEEVEHKIIELPMRAGIAGSEICTPSGPSGVAEHDGCCDEPGEQCCLLPLVTSDGFGDKSEQLRPAAGTDMKVFETIDRAAENRGRDWSYDSGRIGRHDLASLVGCAAKRAELRGVHESNQGDSKYVARWRNHGPRQGPFPAWAETPLLC